MFIEFFFEVDTHNDYSPKKLLKVIVKVIIYILGLMIFIYFLLDRHESVTISR